MARETGRCDLVALADADIEHAHRIRTELGVSVPLFSSVKELSESGMCDAAVVVTPTNHHREHALTMAASGLRILLEKPLTGTLDGDQEFAAELDRDYPDAVMLGFQRRFDEPLVFAKKLVTDGAIGRVFKIYSALEDSSPAPDGYVSGGLLPDMSVHNVDEILWLVGRMPSKALAIGSRIYSYAHTTSDEDFDDALLYLWFDRDLIGQIQVSRNHVSGYRTETIIFGEEGQIHVGRFEQNQAEVIVEAYGRRGRQQPLARQAFPMRDYGHSLPEFVERFGPAYKRELAAFVECCNTGAKFPATHRDGLRAQQVISAGMEGMIGSANAAHIESGLLNPK